MHYQIRTSAPDGSGTGRKYLGQLGTVSGVSPSWTVPGGCELLTAELACDNRLRTEALNPGRYVEAVLGGDVAWDGFLAEPQQSDTGWSLTATGSGTFGSLYNADYTGAWASAVPDTVIGSAGGRGLLWLASTMGHPAGVFLGQPPDSGSIKVDDMLNQLCSLGGLTWWVKRTPRGNLPQMFALPTAPTRLLVATQPAARTLGGDYNAIEIRYQATPDLGSGSPATFATTYATDAGSIARHGRNEAYMDLSSTGTMLAADAQAVGNSVLQRYQRASYAGPYQITSGQLLTLGGQPVHLGAFFQGNEGPMVCKVLQTDQAYGGEVKPGPVVFLAGRYVYMEDSDSAEVTPFQTMREDFNSLLASRAALARRHRIVKRTRGGYVWWRFTGTSKWHKGPVTKQGPPAHGKPPINHHHRPHF